MQTSSISMLSTTYSVAGVCEIVGLIVTVDAHLKPDRAHPGLYLIPEEDSRFKMNGGPVLTVAGGLVGLIGNAASLFLP